MDYSLLDKFKTVLIDISQSEKLSKAEKTESSTIALDILLGVLDESDISIEDKDKMISILKRFIDS